MNAVDILGIGAQKSATSWAAHVLNLHSNVWIPQKHAHSGKEVMFWDRHYDKGEHWYARIMTPPDPTMKSMDVSPGYSRIGGKKIARCRNLAPGARIFLLLRNPIYRDWSSLVMEANLRLKVDLESMDTVELFFNYDRTNVAQFCTYASTIENWRRYFGDQLLVGVYDDLAADAHAFYQRLCQHCGLDPDAVPGWGSKIEKRIFEGPTVPLPEDMHRFLRMKYEPMIRRLETLIDRDLSDWLSDTPRVQ